MVLGQGTSERGLVIHFQRPGFAMAVQGLLLGDQVTWPPFMALFYSSAAELPPGEAQALSEHGCAIAGDSSPFALVNDGHAGTSRAPGSTVRRPRAEELRLLEGCLRALPGFVERHGGAESGREDVVVQVAGGAVRITLAWVTEGEREL
jgi:hypothetical protein